MEVRGDVWKLFHSHKWQNKPRWCCPEESPAGPTSQLSLFHWLLSCLTGTDLIQATRIPVLDACSSHVAIPFPPACSLPPHSLLHRATQATFTTEHHIKSQTPAQAHGASTQPPGVNPNHSSPGRSTSHPAQPPPTLFLALYAQIHVSSSSITEEPLFWSVVSINSYHIVNWNGETLKYEHT